MAAEHVNAFLDRFSRELAEAIQRPGEVRVVENDGAQVDPENLVWWSGTSQKDPQSQFFLGAEQATFEQVTQDFGIFKECLQKALEPQFSGELVADDGATAEAPTADWAKIAIAIGNEDTALSLFCVLSPGLESALGRTAVVQRPAESGFNPFEMLKHVEVPISVSFGGAQIRMKELLSLTTGSVVELNQALSDVVEVRVNNRVIARGEVVAVDGYYGVRVLEMVASPKGEEA